LLLTSFVDQEHPRYADIPVNARALFFGRLRSVWSTGYGIFSLVAPKLNLTNPPGRALDQAL